MRQDGMLGNAALRRDRLGLKAPAQRRFHTETTEKAKPRSTTEQDSFGASRCDCQAASVALRGFAFSVSSVRTLASSGPSVHPDRPAAMANTDDIAARTLYLIAR